MRRCSRHACLRTNKKASPQRGFSTTLVALLRHPAAVHVPGHAANVVAGSGAEKHRQFAQLFRGGELLGGLFFTQQQFSGSLVAQAQSFGFGIHLLLYQGREHPARTNGITGNTSSFTLADGDHFYLNGHKITFAASDNTLDEIILKINLNMLGLNFLKVVLLIQDLKN